MQRILATTVVATLGISMATGTSLSQVSAQSRSLEVKEKFISTVTQLDLREGTITMPLIRGVGPDGGNAWYVLTESSNEGDAERRGINPAPKLANALGTKAVQHVTRSNGVVHFSGTVDFSPTRVVVPSEPNGFPPEVAKPGAVADARYSPLITTGNGVVLNASQVKNATGRHDSVLSVDWKTHMVTLDGFFGFYDGNKVLYLKLDASTSLLAALEASTFAPNLNAAPGIGEDDEDTSAREAIIPAVNGPRGINNSERQGLESALLGQGDPLNIIQEEPGDDEYSPVWDVTPFVWTQAAIADGERQRLESADEVAREFERGNIVSAGFSTGPRNDSLEGLRAGGFISNCPVVALLK